MKPNKISYKKTSFYNKNENCFKYYDNSTEIRLGINSADEKARTDLRKRKIEAPLSIEERILIKK